MKQIPYGIDDFERIINDGYYYIDKTRYIPTVEDQNSYILLVRPRRMGKSLFTNMLMSYYDLGKKEDFDSLFGDLWIGKNPTRLANSFLVLKFDFSHIDTSRLEENFTIYCKNCLKDFLWRYHEIFDTSEQTEILSQKSVKDSIIVLDKLARLKKMSTYLFIDEYDNFSNMVLSARGVKAHEQITHGEGFYRDFFKGCKGTFTRIFMSGVAPVTYDDLTSGFNIADVVSLNPLFESAIGVTETELRTMIEYYRSEGKIHRDATELVAEMKPWYDNFCFCEDSYGVQPPIYNTDMVMRYMKEMLSLGRGPKDMIDLNARTDYKKLNYLVLAEELDNRERRIEIIKDISAKGYITGNVHEQFPASRCGDEENFKSMLYYYGTLTFGGWEDGRTVLRVPNLTMGELYLSYMLHLVESEGLDLRGGRKALQEGIRQAAVFGNWQEMVLQAGLIYSQYSSLRNSIRGEADVQGFLRGLLCLNDYFAIWPELELGHGYCDILLVPKGTLRCATHHSYVIEIKYIKAHETHVEESIKAATEQLSRYVADYALSDSNLLRGTDLTQLYLVFRGHELVAQGECGLSQE